MRGPTQCSKMVARLVENDCYCGVTMASLPNMGRTTVCGFIPIYLDHKERAIVDVFAQVQSQFPKTLGTSKNVRATPLTRALQRMWLDSLMAIASSNTVPAGRRTK